jgi:hypothetical protein
LNGGWWIEDDVECWILNGGLADEESFQRILNQGLSQRLQQGGLGVRKFWMMDFKFWIGARSRSMVD